MIRRLMLTAASIALAGCATLGDDGRATLPEMSSLAVIPQRTQTQNLLAAIPAPQRPIASATVSQSRTQNQFGNLRTGGSSNNSDITQTAAAGGAAASLTQKGELNTSSIMQTADADATVKQTGIYNESNVTQNAAGANAKVTQLGVPSTGPSGVAQGDNLSNVIQNGACSKAFARGWHGASGSVTPLFARPPSPPASVTCSRSSRRGTRARSSPRNWGSARARSRTIGRASRQRPAPRPSPS